MDAATNIYTVATYYKSDELVGQANALLVMVVTNILIQMSIVHAQNKKTSARKMLMEAMISLSFLRPAVDAYRVCMNHKDSDSAVDSLDLMIFNKVTELATEAIPGCVLQIYVWLTNREQAGTYALMSIAISAMCTGFARAMIASDKDVDHAGRKSQPKFYGLIPADNTLRSRCLILMTLIGAIHNMSRSLRLALLLASPSRGLVVYFVVGEVTVYVGERAK